MVSKIEPHQDRGENRNLTAPPSISLPKGGGAIRGMGEKFAANPVTGTGSMTIPIAASPGRSGFGPQLELAYDSGAGNGPFGFGLRLCLPSFIQNVKVPMNAMALERNVLESGESFQLEAVPYIAHFGAKKNEIGA